MEEPMIQFVCVAVAHRPQRIGEHPSTVTIHAGQWAYCDSPVEADHDWVATGGVALEALRRRGAIELRSA